ncbi:MAG: hypothetical protein ACRCYV_02395 [Aeromonas sp.]
MTIKVGINGFGCMGRWAHHASHDGATLCIGATRIGCTQNSAISDTDWSACDVVIDASGKMKSKALLSANRAAKLMRLVGLRDQG